MVVFIVLLWIFVVDKSYIKFENFQKNAGLWHHTYNLRVILKYAYHNNMIPIIPMFELGEPEGMGSERIFDSNLSEYYDYSELKIDGKPFEVMLDDEHLREKLFHRGVIPNTVDVFDFSKTHLGKQGKYVGYFLGIEELMVDGNVDIELPFHQHLVDISSNVIHHLGKYVCVHVRRGDVLSQYSDIDEATQSENILKVLDELVDDSYNVYIMTNEFDLSLFDDITKKYNTYFYTDFANLKGFDDNYKLFSIELLIMKSANKKVSTFERNYIHNIGQCDRWLYES